MSGGSEEEGRVGACGVACRGVSLQKGLLGPRPLHPSIHPIIKSFVRGRGERAALPPLARFSLTPRPPPLSRPCISCQTARTRPRGSFWTGCRSTPGTPCAPRGAPRGRACRRRGRCSRGRLSWERRFGGEWGECSAGGWNGRRRPRAWRRRGGRRVAGSMGAAAVRPGRHQGEVEEKRATPHGKKTGWRWARGSRACLHASKRSLSLHGPLGRHPARLPGGRVGLHEAARRARALWRERGRRRGGASPETARDATAQIHPVLPRAPQGRVRLVQERGPLPRPARAPPPRPKLA